MKPDKVSAMTAPRSVFMARKFEILMSVAPGMY